MRAMTFSEQAAGLFFSAEALELARDSREDDSIGAAIALLDQQPADALTAAYFAGLRYRLRRDVASGAIALAGLRAGELFVDSGEDRRAVKRALGWCAVAALLIDHPAAQIQQATIGAAIKAKTRQLQIADAADDLIRGWWLGALTMATGLLLGDEEECERGARVYRRAVDRHIHPEGYLKGIVDQELVGASYEDQLSGTGALVIIAEMAQRAQLDLWAYNNRGVTPITAAAYTYYYYFFPEKWRWETGLSRERAIAVMRAEGAFMEIAHQRHALHGVEQLFAEQRPCFCAWGGGLTSLTHSLKPKTKRWRLW